MPGVVERGAQRLRSEIWERLNLTYRGTSLQEVDLTRANLEEVVEELNDKNRKIVEKAIEDYSPELDVLVGEELLLPAMMNMFDTKGVGSQNLIDRLTDAGKIDIIEHIGRVINLEDLVEVTKTLQEYEKVLEETYSCSEVAELLSRNKARISNSANNNGLSSIKLFYPYTTQFTLRFEVDYINKIHEKVGSYSERAIVRMIRESGFPANKVVVSQEIKKLIAKDEELGVTPGFSNRSFNYKTAKRVRENVIRRTKRTGCFDPNYIKYCALESLQTKNENNFDLYWQDYDEFIRLQKLRARIVENITAQTTLSEMDSKEALSELQGKIASTLEKMLGNEDPDLTTEVALPLEPEFFNTKYAVPKTVVENLLATEIPYKVGLFGYVISIENILEVNKRFSEHYSLLEETIGPVELAELTGFARGTITNQATAGRIPAVKIQEPFNGREIYRFNKAQVREIITKLEEIKESVAGTVSCKEAASLIGMSREHLRYYAREGIAGSRAIVNGRPVHRFNSKEIRQLNNRLKTVSLKAMVGIAQGEGLQVGEWKVSSKIQKLIEQEPSLGVISGLKRRRYDLATVNRVIQQLGGTNTFSGITWRDSVRAKSLNLGQLLSNKGDMRNMLLYAKAHNDPLIVRKFSQDLYHMMLGRIRTREVGRYAATGAWEAINSYNLYSGVPFTHHLRQHVQEFIREVRREYTSHETVSVEAYLRDIFAESAPDALETLEEKEKVESLYRMLDGMDPEKRSIVELYYEEGYSAADIADAMGKDDVESVLNQFQESVYELWEQEVSRIVVRRPERNAS